MLLGKMQLNQSAAESEMLRILWKAEALKHPSVVKASEEVLKKLGEKNDSLVKEKELNNKIAAESLA
jgi:hypothetical protein